MDCDYYADENGEFELTICDYASEEPLDGLVIGGLQPKQHVEVVIRKGIVR